MQVFAIERADRNEFYDLFCSRQCCRMVYGLEKPELLSDDDLYERMGIKLEGRVCFCCGEELK